MKKYFMGMDIGTNSNGIACTDENYRLMRAKGKDCWAVRLFDESKTAAERRGYRTARRRLERRKQRLGFLQALFAPFIEDENFFLRLNNSAYYADDKAEVLGGDKNSLFADENYTDKNYHTEFPTVYHLRNALQTEPIADLRLYYLAIHHIVKYRGHFLFEGSMADVRNIGILFDDLTACCAELYADAEHTPYFPSALAEQAKSCLLNRQTSSRSKQTELEKLFGGDAYTKEIVKGMCGLSVSPKTLLGNSYKDEPSFNFKKLTDETFDGMRSDYGDDFILLEKIRAIYSFITFEKLLVGQPNISCAMIKLYEDHKRDLLRLKNYLRENATVEEYRKFFKSATEDDNYVHYVGYTKKGGDKIKVKPCTDEAFFGALKKLLLRLPSGESEDERQAMLSAIDAGTFLPKILHSDNGLFPHQVNEDELVKIVENMVKMRPETAEMAQKILPVFLYRIPYYVGPLTGKNSWVERSAEKITPWNFDTVVDKAKSNERFMRRMTNKCTYLHGEDVLPQASIYYQKYDVLNQLNALRINDCPINVALKKQIFDELFLVKPKVTDRMILDLLVRHGLISEAEKSDVKLSGKDGEFKAGMRSYIQLKKILGGFVDEDLLIGGGVCENIILWHTLNTDKNVVAELIKRNYDDIPAIKAHIQQLKGLTFQKFGRFSKKFLTELRVREGAQAGMSILDLLYETNENLNQILYNESYGLDAAIKAENGETSAEVTYEDVENLYVSPTVRRGIWQSLQMADEYIAAIGSVPDKIFIEVTRADGQKGDKGRTVSRKQRLLQCYKGLHGYDDVTEELNGEEISDLRLRQERLYLYFRQLGRCMYSGERIDLGEINTDRYDVDHILPRSYDKDDSLDNKVLVLRSKNAEKRDIYPLPENFTTQQPFWKMLHEKGLIGDVTLKRLMRVEPLGENDYKGFINRQKVITDQTAKAVAELLARKYPTAKIVYSKAKNVSDFRQKFDLFKCRISNDLHHALDAYLNIVVGNVYDTCFSTPMQMFYKKGDEWREYNLKTMFVRDVQGAWDSHSIATVKAVYARKSMAVTRYAYCEKGQFYDQTVYAHNDASITAPRKGTGILGNAERYGGYKSQTTAYFAAIEYTGKKEKRIKAIEAVPVLVDLQSKGDPNVMKTYFENTLGLRDVTVLVPKIKCKQLITYNGMPLYITGVTGNRIKCINAVQLYTDNGTDEYIKALGEFYERHKTSIDEMQEEKFIIKTNRMGDVKLAIDRNRNCLLYKLLYSKLEDKIYGGMSACKNFLNILRNGEAAFETLSVAKQISVLLQVLNFFQCNAMLSNLTAIGGSANSGTILFGKNISDADVRLVHQSPCGLTVREQKI